MLIKMQVINLVINLYKITLLLDLIITTSECSNILGIISIPSYSHQIVFQPIWKELSLRGHQVTVLTTNPVNDKSLINLTEIDLSIGYDIYFQRHNFNEIVLEASLFKALHDGNLMEYELINTQLSNNKVQDLITNKSKTFDLVMVEYFHEPFFAFSKRFNCPLIGLTSLDLNIFGHQTIGNPINPSIYPDYFIPFEEMTLYERLYSCAAFLFMTVYRIIVLTPRNDGLVRKHFGEDFPAVSEIAEEISMVFVNINPVFNNNRPLGPNTIAIGGGIHILEDNKSVLNQDISRFLNESTDGVIYFSFGTNVKTKSLSSKFKSVMLECFSELPYKILWKVDDYSYIKNKPRNVKLIKWISQLEVLKHPNVKLFITQGGLQSLEETVFCQKPVIVIPFIGDQFANARKVESIGYGIMLNYKTIRKDLVMDSILSIMVTSKLKFKNKVMETSKLLFDNPLTGLERAIWWTEYVIRHKGANHLKSPKIPFYQYLFIDLITIISVIIICFVMLVKYVIKLIICKVKIE